MIRRPACQASALSWPAGFSLSSHTYTRRELSGIHSIRALIPRTGTQSPPRPHLPTPSSGVRFQYLNFEDPNIQPITEQIWKNMPKSNLFC